MSNRTLIRTGGAGSVVAAICCFTPVLVVVLGAAGLAAWLAYADYVLFPLLFACLGLLALGLYRHRIAAQQACCDPASSRQGVK